MKGELFTTLDTHYDEMVQIRRHLHQYPEVSFHEHETAKLIKNYYRELQLPFRSKVGGNGVVARLKGAKPGKTIALRADFDALPIQDEKDVPYRSKVPGVMHACAHDGHTAMLLVLAKVLTHFRDQLPGEIVFIHQHAEELAPGGAKAMIEDGALEGVDVVYGNHLWTNTPFTEIHTAPDNLMAAADRFTITLHGKGGHGAIPHQTKDPIAIGAQLITSLQQIVSRRIDPLATAVLTIGRFEAGDTFNVIPDTAAIEGTVRTFDPTLRDWIVEEMERVIKGVALSGNIDYIFDYRKGYPPVVNHPDYAERVIHAAKEVPEVKKAGYVQPTMTGEDFSYYLQERPGAFFFTGAAMKDQFVPHHHPRFDIEERAMLIGAKTLASVTLNTLNESKSK